MIQLNEVLNQHPRITVAFLRKHVTIFSGYTTFCITSEYKHVHECILLIFLVSADQVTHCCTCLRLLLPASPWSYTTLIVQVYNFMVVCSAVLLRILQESDFIRDSKTKSCNRPQPSPSTFLQINYSQPHCNSPPHNICLTREWSDPTCRNLP
jgi:hypothetical protein